MDVTVESPFPDWALPNVWSWSREFRAQVYDDGSPRTVEEFVAYGSQMSRAGKSWAVSVNGELGGLVLSHAASISSQRIHVIFKRAFWSGGITQAAMSLVFAELFGGPCNKILGFPFADNYTVIAFLKRLGFRKEGRLKQQTIRDGVFIDVIAMGLLKEDYLHAIRRTTDSGDHDRGVGDRGRQELENLDPGLDLDVHTGTVDGAGRDGQRDHEQPGQPFERSGPLTEPSCGAD